MVIISFLKLKSKSKSKESVVDRQQVTFLARTRNVTQRIRPNSQGLIKSMRLPSSHVIFVAAAELARKALAQTSSQKAPQKERIPRLAQMGRVRQKQKEKSKA